MVLTDFDMTARLAARQREALSNGWSFWHYVRDFLRPMFLRIAQQ
jgi:hypothetical protein